MKRLFLGVFGGFCVVIALIGVFNFLYFFRLHGLQEELVCIDNIAQQAQEHKELVQQFGQHNELFDHVAVAQQRVQASNAAFWENIRRSLSDCCSSARQKGFSCKWSEKRPFLDKLEHSEQNLITEAAAIGFKEYGLVGRMREQAHSVESRFPRFKARLLMLRRHEKDFLMRIDPAYHLKLDDEVRQWADEGTLPPSVEQYARHFDTLSVAYIRFFETRPTGRYFSWNTRFDQFQHYIREQRSALLKASFAESDKARIVNLLINCTAILLALLCTIFFTRRFSKQVVHLQQTMEQYIAANYNHSPDMLLKIPKNEFGKITLHFLQLTRKIKADVHLLEDRVSRRTRSLQAKNTQLEIQHREIMDSLKYARDLQQSLLVSRSKILRSFHEADVFYQPKELVGGDFYWLKEIRKGKIDRVYFALADCTGHGVPGALLSVMGMNALDELIDAGVLQPADLLNELRSLITRRLNTHEDKRYDGMDLALFCWDRKTDQLQFSGAQMPLWILRDERLIELSGQRMPIGYTFFETTAFAEQTIQLQPDDRLILFSDGIVDQFGGTRNRKMGKKVLRELLLKLANEPSPVFFSKLIQQLEYWKGTTEQTDDCTLLLLEPGVKVVRKAARTEMIQEPVQLPASTQV